MTDSDKQPQVRLFGWCSPHDQYHRLCKVSYTDAHGRTHMCGCPNDDHGTDRP